MSAERINFYMTLAPNVTARLVALAEQRQMKPADLAEKIIETVIGDDILNAVLDDHT